MLTNTVAQNVSAPRVVNGQDATDAPYYVQLSIDISGSFYLCGGSLLAANWVVTAAHCLYDIQQGSVVVTVTAGTLLKSGTGGVTKTVDKFYLDPNYIPGDNDKSGGGSDIALLWFSNPFTLSSNIQVIPLAASNPAGGTQALVTGFGGVNAKDESGTELTNYPAATTLQEAFVSIVDEATAARWILASGTTWRECDPAYSYIENMAWDKLVATGSDTTPVKDSCQGDSGGPLAVADSTSPVGYSLVAVVSFGFGCAVQSMPGFYTSVPGNSQWLTATMANPPSLCGTKQLTCGPNAECVTGACQCKAGNVAFNSITDPYGYSCGMYLFSGIPQSASIIGYSNQLVFELLPVKNQWDSNIIRSWDLPTHVSTAAGFDGCGYAWYTDTGISISSVLAEVTTVATAAGSGTAPSTIWTGQTDTTGTWQACYTTRHCHTMGDLTSQWASGEPKLNYAAASFASNALVTQSSSTSTWVVIAYAKSWPWPSHSAASIIGSPAPASSPGGIFVPSSALQTQYSLLLLVPVSYLMLQLVA